MKIRARILLAFVLGHGLPAVTASCSRPHSAAAAAHYLATGEVRSFGPNRSFVRIAHEEIPGFMKAMTMPFEGTAEQLGKLATGDKVDFEFDDVGDGRLVLTRIQKRP